MAAQSKVAVISTHPSRVVEDYARLLDLAGYQKTLNAQTDLLLKLNLSWTKFFPSCSTPPWAFEGVVKKLLADGFNKEKLFPVENKTVVTNPHQGVKNNGWGTVLQRYGLKFYALPEVEWVKYEFKSPLLVLPQIFPEGIYIPKMFIGKQILHLPTVKTHGHSVTTGAIKNSFGGLLREVRHYVHKHIHQGLVDLLYMQRELHPAVFAVMDGTIAGDGAGPRTMVPRVKNVLLASADSVAIDAVAAKMMGFNPLEIPYLRLAQEHGLGQADLEKIKIVGEPELVEKADWGFKSKKSLVIWGDQLLRRGGLKFLERLALHSPLWRWAPLASNLYHDWFWYPIIGRRYLRAFAATEWGQLFRQYQSGQ